MMASPAITKPAYAAPLAQYFLGVFASAFASGGGGAGGASPSEGEEAGGGGGGGGGDSACANATALHSSTTRRVFMNYSEVTAGVLSARSSSSSFSHFVFSSAVRSTTFSSMSCCSISW